MFFSSKKSPYIVALSLAILTFTVYFKIISNEFVIYDDDEYIMENTNIQSGLNAQSLKWAFTTTYASNWHPLTWLSHIVDYQLYSMNPAGHHLTNLLLHILNTVFLFLVMKQMTRRIWECAFVAAVFGIHPLHVESVAWAAERKDVLSTLFGIATIGMYTRYVRNQHIKNYLSVTILFTLGLMSKPMLVTLPFVLLLLDYWPLNRMGFIESDSGVHQRVRFSHLLREKVPLFLLAAISCVVTFVIQQKAGATSQMEIIPLPDRIANALVSYVSYIAKMFWPSNLAVMYPFHGFTLGSWQAWIASIILIFVTWMVIRRYRQSPYLLVGWLWFLGILVPVIGLIQAGAQSMADRYTYVPLVGLLLMLTWGASDLSATWKARNVILGISAGIVILLLCIVTTSQISYWHDSVALFKHSLAVTENNAIIHNNLGVVLARQEKFNEASEHFSEALRINPAYIAASENLNHAREKLKMTDAVTRNANELELDPNSANAHFNSGNLLAQQGKNKEAIEQFMIAVRLNPNLAYAHNNLASLLAREGKTTEAIEHYKEALRIKSDFWTAHYNLGLALGQQGKISEAIIQFNEALKGRPADTEIQSSLEHALTIQERYKKKDSLQQHR